jgi:hypothetical protein
VLAARSQYGAAARRGNGVKMLTISGFGVERPPSLLLPRLLLLLGRCGGAAAVLPAFVFNVSDGGGATLTVGNDGAETSTFYMQSQFSELPIGNAPLWTTLQPPWGGTPHGFVVDRSGEAQGRTVVRAQSSYTSGLWGLERAYQLDGHRILVNDTLTVPRSAATAGWAAIPIYIRQILSAEVIGSVRELVIPGALYTYDCNSLNHDRGSFGAPQVWMTTDTAAVGMMPLDDVFRVHSVGFNHALAKQPRATTQTCEVSVGASLNAAPSHSIPVVLIACVHASWPQLTARTRN